MVRIAFAGHEQQGHPVSVSAIPANAIRPRLERPLHPDDPLHRIEGMGQSWR